MVYELEEIKRISSKYDTIKKVVLFGSRARGDNSPRSDFDIAIYFNDKPEYQLLDDIEQIETLLKIDTTIVSENLDRSFLNNIETEGITIYEQV